MTVAATVIRAAKPRAAQACPKRTTYVSVSINTATGHVHALATEDRKEAEIDFTRRGDPPTWRGIQIIQVDTW